MLALVFVTSGLSRARLVNRADSSAVAPAHVSISISAAAHQRVRAEEQTSRAERGPPGDSMPGSTVLGVPSK
jgi:hypothetical protein